MTIDSKYDDEKCEYFDHTIKRIEKEELDYHSRSPRTVECFHVRDRDQKTLGFFQSLSAAKLAIDKYWLGRAEDQVERARVLLKDAEDGLTKIKAFVNSHN